MQLRGLSGLLSSIGYISVHAAIRLIGAAVIASPILGAGYFLGWEPSITALYLIAYFLVLAHVSRLVFERRMSGYFRAGFVGSTLVGVWLATIPTLLLGTLGSATFLLPWWLVRRKPEEESISPAYREVSRWEVPPKEELQRKWRAYGFINVASSLISETKKEGDVVEKARDRLGKAEQLYASKDYDEAAVMAKLARTTIEVD